MRCCLRNEEKKGREEEGKEKGKEGRKIKCKEVQKYNVKSPFFTYFPMLFPNVYYYIFIFFKDMHKTEL